MNDPEILKRLPTVAGCWAHARRKFVDAEKVSPEATEVVKMIGVLYGIERTSKSLVSKRVIPSVRKNRFGNRIASSGERMTKSANTRTRN